MNSNYRFTVVEDQLLLALRDQGHYNGDFIAQILGRGEWALKHRYRMLHSGGTSTNPRGRGKMEVRSYEKLRMSKGVKGWTPRRDYVLQALHSEGHDWVEISYKLPPYNGPECLARWLSLNPQARYPFKTHVDFLWTIQEINKLLSMKREGRSWGEIAKALPWDETQCRKHWLTNHWSLFIHWLPDGRNFRDPETQCRKYWFTNHWSQFTYWLPDDRNFRDPQSWQPKVGAHPHEQGHNINTTARSTDKYRKAGREREREDEFAKTWDEAQVRRKAALNRNQGLGATTGLNSKDTEAETSNEEVGEISEARYRKEITRGVNDGFEQPKRKASATMPKDKTASKKPKTSKQDAERGTEMEDDGEARYMLEQAEQERYRIIHPKHAAERQSYRY